VEINCSYRLSAMNVHLSDWLDEHSNDRGYILGWLERLLTKWDIVDDSGAPIPTTKEAMEQYAIATPILRMMLDACYDDGNARNLKNSYAAGSSASGISRQNGTH